MKDQQYKKENTETNPNEVGGKVAEQAADLTSLLAVIKPLDKLLRDEAMGTKGPNHAEEKERAEAAYRKWLEDTATPLERYGEALSRSTQLRGQIRPSTASRRRPRPDWMYIPASRVSQGQ